MYMVYLCIVCMYVRALWVGYMRMRSEYILNTTCCKWLLILLYSLQSAVLVLITILFNLWPSLYHFLRVQFLYILYVCLYARKCLFLLLANKYCQLICVCYGFGTCESHCSFYAQSFFLLVLSCLSISLYISPQALLFKLILSHLFMYFCHWRIFICIKVPSSQAMSFCNLCFCCFNFLLNVAFISLRSV